MLLEFYFLNLSFQSQAFSDKKFSSLDQAVG